MQKRHFVNRLFIGLLIIRPEILFVRHGKFSTRLSVWNGPDIKFLGLRMQTNNNFVKIIRKPQSEAIKQKAKANKHIDKRQIWSDTK